MAHAASIFFDRGIAKMDTREFSSLSAERVPAAAEGEGAAGAAEREPLIVTLFEIPVDQLPAFYAREEEFLLETVPYREGLPSAAAAKAEGDGAGAAAGAGAGAAKATGAGLMCLRSSDAHYVATRGQEAFDTLYKARGLHTIWHWDRILPCRVYLRHCVLAARALGPEAEANFLSTTFCYDGSTTIGEYLGGALGGLGTSIMEEEPPEAVRGRYSG